jgi:tRNA(fMet)-specific endonuclease VapC
MFILDTDHVSLWLRNHPLVRVKVAESAQNVSLTIITVQELSNGWVGRLNNTTDSALTIERYENLWQTVDFVRQFPVLKFDARADDCYIEVLHENANLRKKRLRQDLRIAAISLSQNATIVTRTQRDFSQVPGLQIVDWSI